MKENNSTGRILRPSDIILIAGLLLVSAIALVYLFFFREEGNKVKVTVDGKVFGTYLLSENITRDIVTGKESENRNVFVIKDGKAYMESATCPDGICVDHRPVFRDGESIVCLPNRVVITVINEDDKDSLDIVA